MDPIIPCTADLHSQWRLVAQVDLLTGRNPSGLCLKRCEFDIYKCRYQTINSNMTSPSLLLGLLLVLPTLVWLFKRRRSRLPLPPGPKGWPIVGNLKDLDHEDKHTWLRYTDWMSTYGDVVYLEAFGKPIVILNSAEATTELLEKRSSNYSDRPEMTMANDPLKVFLTKVFVATNIKATTYRRVRLS